MAAIDDIREVAQDVYYTINGAENDDTGADLTTFENNFIRGFNLWLDEYDGEAYWNNLRTDDYVLGTVSNTTTYSFPLDDEFRSPVINQNKYVKFIVDGIVIARFQLVDPNQRVVDYDYYHPTRATFVGRNIVLSRPPTAEELGATIVLDVVGYMPKLTRTDASALDYLYNKQIAVLGVAKNSTLSDVTKVSLSPSFAQKYANELQKAVTANNATTANDDARRDDYGYIAGIW